MGYVDLHNHVLFGLDDGSTDLSVSLAMLRGLVDLGFSEICATPHQKAGHYMPAWPEIERTYAEISTAIAREPWAPRMHLAAENMWDDVFFERMQHGTIPSYDGGSAFLFELRPHEVPVGLTDYVFKLQMAGKLPVLAHPERYQAMWSNDALLMKLRESCALVVDLGALGGAHGKNEAKAARRMIEDDIAHAVASDSHNVGDVRLAAEGIAWIKKRKGDRAVTRLLDDAPRAILTGELPDGP